MGGYSLCAWPTVFTAVFIDESGRPGPALTGQLIHEDADGVEQEIGPSYATAQDSRLMAEVMRASASITDVEAFAFDPVLGLEVGPTALNDVDSITSYRDPEYGGLVDTEPLQELSGSAWSWWYIARGLSDDTPVAWDGLTPSS